MWLLLALIMAAMSTRPSCVLFRALLFLLFITLLYLFPWAFWLPGFYAVIMPLKFPIALRGVVVRLAISAGSVWYFIRLLCMFWLGEVDWPTCPR